MRALANFLFLVVFIFNFQSYGQSQLTSDILDVKNKLEKDIQQNFKNIISTRLNSENFFVAVSVQTKLVPPQKDKDKNKPIEKLPAGIDLGLISAAEMAESYDREIEELKLKKETLDNQEKPKYQINRIEILVGLDKSLDKDYIKKFKSWLQDKVKSDYGQIGFADISLVDRHEIPKKETKTPENPYSFDKLRLLIAAGLLAFALILIGFFLWSGLSRVASSAKPLQIQPSGELKVQGLGGAQTATLPKEDDNKKLTAQTIDPALRNLIDQTISKIAFVCLESQDRLPELINVWINTNNEGFLKTSLLVDTILTAREKIMQHTGTLANLSIPLSEDFALTYREELGKAYQAVVNLDPSERLLLLEKIYWDLVAQKTLGLQSLRSPFDYLQKMAKEEVLLLLKSQKEDTRAMVILYLPNKLKSELLREFSTDEQERILAKMLNHGQIPDYKIWDFDTSVKVSLINQSSAPSERLVNLFPKTLDLLQSLTPLEEIRILRKICASLDQDGRQLKTQYSTLAFIDEWSIEFLKKLTPVATADELVTLLKIIPEAKDTILSTCAEKTRTIIMDDLNISSITDDTAINSKLTSLKLKWDRLASSENISMSKVILASNNEDKVHEAA